MDVLGVFGVPGTSTSSQFSDHALHRIGFGFRAALMLLLYGSPFLFVSMFAQQWDASRATIERHHKSGSTKKKTVRRYEPSYRAISNTFTKQLACFSGENLNLYYTSTLQEEQCPCKANSNSGRAAEIQQNLADIRDFSLVIVARKSLEFTLTFSPN